MHASSQAELGVGAIYRDHHAFVRSCLRRFRLHEDDLDDAVQDVFAAMLGHAGAALDRSRAVRPWLFGISRNTASNARRRAARRSRLIVHAPETPAPTTPHEHAERSEAGRMLEHFLDRLDPEKLAPFVLLEIEALPARDVAERLGLSVTTVRWRARAARAELERLAGQREGARLSSFIVWLWPWHSARLGPWLAWFAVAGLVLAWLVAPTRASSTTGDAGTHIDGSVRASGASVDPSGRRDAPERTRTAASLPVDPKAATITGRVMDRDGRPIAHALVCHTIDISARARVEDIEPGCAHTDAQGGYHLDGVRAGTHRIDASAPGYLPADHGGAHGTGLLPIAAATRHSGIDIVLRRGGVRVAGTVVDETGGVVPGAVVRRMEFDRLDGSSRTIADDEGRFELWVPPGPVGLTASAEGYAEGRAGASAPQDGIELRVMPEVVLAGRVIDGAGAPVPDIRVRANPERDNASEQFTFTTTDGEGRFALRRLAPGRYRPTAEGPTGFARADATLTLAFGEPAPELVLVVAPATTVRVQIEAPAVLDGCEGDWLSGSTAGHHWGARLAGSHGTLEGVPPGRLELTTNCRGHAVVAVVEITGVEPVEATLRVQPRATVEGRAIVAEDGLGAFLGIRLIPAGTVLDGPMLPKGTVTTQTDGDGHFVAALPDAGDFEIIGATRTGASLPLGSFAVDDGQHVDLGSLSLPALGRIEGRVTDPDGKGVGGLYVAVKRRAGLGTFTRPDGTFSLLELIPGEYVLDAQQHIVPVDGATQLVSVVGGDTARVVLSVPRFDGVISGVVVDAEGSPIPDAKVVIATPARDPSDELVFRTVAKVQADGDGKFKRAALLPGDYEIEVSALVGEGSNPDRPGCEGKGRTQAEARGGSSAVVTCR